MPDNYIDINTEAYRQSKSNEAQNLTSCVIFRKDNEWLALSSAILNEISERKSIHSLPHFSSKLIAGLVNIRGELEICIALENALSLKHHEVQSERISARMIVIVLDSGKYVIEADEVHGIFKVPADSIKQPPVTLSQDENNLISGVFDYDDRHIGLLDSKRLNRLTTESLS